jgi:tetratricopeptide (TPR) repeat protein
VELIEQVEQLQADLPAARFAEEPPADREIRRQVRTFLSGQLGNAAERLRRNRQPSEALRAYTVLDRLGAMGITQRAGHARLRWQLHDRSPYAIRVYLRTRDERDGGNGAARDPVLVEIDRFVDESLAVDESSSPHVLAERLVLNQLALCSPRPPHPAWRNAGLAYLRLAQAERALPYLEQARSLNGSDGGAIAFYLGQARFQVADYSASAAAFEEATAHGFSKVRIAAWLGLAYARIREWERALAIFREAETSAGEVQAGELYLNWGRASFVVGEVRDALLRFDTAAVADETDPRAGYGLALCWESLGQPGNALAELQKVETRFPGFAPAAHRLGLMFEAAGNLPGAIERFRQAVSLEPEDPEYCLSLGLVLASASDPEALPHLERAAAAGIGGPEVLRRLTLLCLRQGDRQRARDWLEALAAADSESPAVTRFRVRDLASQATEAFNAGRYRDASAQWEQVAQESPGEAAVEERLALSLVHDTAMRIREGEVDGLAEAIQRAFELTPANAECRLFLAAVRLLAGDFGPAAELLRELVEEEPARRSGVELLLWVSAVLAGEEEASLLGLLRVLRAASNGRFEEAATCCETWLADAGAGRAAGLSPDLLNALVATIKVRGTRRRRQQVLRFLEGLEARDGAGSWAPALVLARQTLATEKGLAHAGDADLTELTACQAAWHSLFGGSPPERSTLEARRLFLQQYARLLVFLACHHAQRGRLAAALGVLDELEGLPLPAPAGSGDLQRLLRRRLDRPSHEKAFALLEEDPAAARQTWESLLQEAPSDLLALHHLACLAWSQAYDAVLDHNVEGSLCFWRDGLEHFRQLYGSDAYWQAQEEKGRALGASTAHPFDEAAFQEWRRNALHQRASTLLHLVFHLLAGADVAQAQDADVLCAGSLIALLRESNLDAATRQRLADDLADHYLDPDPTRVPDFARSRSRAEKVLDIDPANVKARTFLLRSVTYEVGIRSEEGDRDVSALVRLLAGIEPHAEWLEANRKELPAEAQGRAVSDLAAYYDRYGKVKHLEGVLVIKRVNENRPPEWERQRLIEQIQQAFRQSDRWFEKSLALDPVNPLAKDRLADHRNFYQQVRS